MQLMNEHLSALCTEIVGLVGARSLNFREICSCGAPEFFGKKEYIASIRWLAHIRNAFWSSVCHEEVKVRLLSCLLKDRTRNW